MGIHQSTTIGIIAPQLSLLYYGEVLAGIHEVFQPHGARLLAIQGSPRQVAATRLAAGHVGGWIVINNIDGIELLAAQGKPIVTIGATAGPEIPAVFPDNRGGTQAAVQHLTEHGHRRIAFAGHLADFDTQQRYQGYLAALEQAGAAPDPALVFDVPANTVIEGYGLAARLGGPERPCTALACATDELALGLLLALNAAGTQLPGELAIVGFDNILPAQFSDPPLTTVGVSIPAIGAAAARLLLGQLAGEPPGQGSNIPAPLIVRQSCGCPADRSSETLPDSIAQLDWQATLSWQLARVLYPGVAANTASAPEQIWPAGQALVAGCVAALDATPVSAEAIAQACHEAATINNDINNLNAIPNLIERAGIAQIVARGDIGAFARLSELLSQIRAQLLRNVTLTTRSLYRETLELVEQNQQASRLLLSNQNDTAAQLDWMYVTTGLAWGCLGLWESDGRLAIAGSYQRRAEAARLDAADFPPGAYMRAPDQPAEPITALLQITSPERDWGVLAVGITIGYLRAATNYDALTNLATLLELALNRQALRARLHDAREHSQALAQQVRELSSPVIPLLPEVLLVPLIGTLDRARVERILEATLQSVVEHQAETVLIDLTGVPLVDDQSANGLVQIARAATLLGAHVHLVGISPEIAQSIVSLGVDLSMIVTEASLSAALQRIGRQGA